MAKVFAFDTTYRIFGSDKFKKELQNGWLKKQSSSVKEKVAEYMNNRMYGYDYIFRNEYCYIIDPLVYRKNITYGPVMCDTRIVYIIDENGFMIYVAPPKNDALHYKILPKEFINKPQEFFENLKFDGFFYPQKLNSNSFDTDKELNHKRTF
jgi:hypothetical protein